MAFFGLLGLALVGSGLHETYQRAQIESQYRRAEANLPTIRRQLVQLRRARKSPTRYLRELGFDSYEVRCWIKAQVDEELSS